MFDEDARIGTWRGGRGGGGERTKAEALARSASAVTREREDTMVT